MKWMLLLLGLAAQVAAQTGTDTNVASLTLSTNRPAPVLSLTPEMEALNQSPYFKSEIDQMRGQVVNRLIINEVGESWMKPSLCLQAIRFHKPGLPPYYLFSICTLAKRSFDLIGFRTNQECVLAVDGTKFALHSDPGMFSAKADVDSSLPYGETINVFVTEDFLRSLAGAKYAQLFIDGVQKTDDRQLSRVNIGRFKVFVDTFIDQKGTYANARPVANVRSPSPPAAPEAPSRAPGSLIIDVGPVTYRVTEANSTWWRFAYQFQVKNNTQESFVEDRIEVRFVDSAGFTIDRKREYDVVLKPLERKVVSGDILIKLPGARNVSAVKTKWP